jgi:hypothetical protein
MSENILQEAEAAVFGPRQDSYGHPRDNFAATAALWNAYLFQGVRRGPVTEEDVALMMVLLKVARLERGYHRDSVVDIAGYAATYERLHEADPQLAEALEALAEEPSPFERARVWDRLIDVPRGVIVQDKDGDFWKRTARGARLGMDHSHAQWHNVEPITEDDPDVLKHWGPFSEVVL